MAILYKANETDFSHLGLGPLNDAISILVTEERNGIFELEMKYPVSGKLFNELKNDRLIKADAGHKLKDQRFKIIRITKPLDGIVTVYAEHVSYLTQDLALKPRVTFTGNARQALEHWKTNLVDDNPFTVWSDISTTGKIEWTIDEVENARRALGGVRGSILDVYGGEYLFDNYDIRLLEKRGVKSEALIAYGRNLVDLTQEEEIANTYTSIYPYSIYTDDDGKERMVTLPEYYVDSPYMENYARRKILVVDFSDEEIKTVSALRNAANRYITNNDVGVPKVNLKIKFLDLSKTLDYKHLALLEEVNLCDEVTVYFEKFGINTTAKVIKVVWDALQHRYDSIEVGEARSSLSQAIDTVVDGKVERIEKLTMQTLRTADGKNTIYFGLEEPTGDQLKENDIWYRIVDGEFTRTYRYDGVTWQLIVDMDSQEAKQEAQQAKDRADEAVERANQATQTANTAIGQAQESFDLAQENATQIDSLGLQIGNVEDGLTTISGTVQGLQTTVSDIDGHVSSLTQLSTLIEARLTDAEGNISSIAQTVISLQSTITDVVEGTQSMFTQLSDAINLRVEKGDVINQINLDTSGVLISGKKLILDGDTTVTGTFKVDNANIISVDAGKITVGDLVGHSLVGGSVIGGYIEQQSGSNRVEIQNGRVSHFRNNELKSVMDGSGHRFYEGGNHIGNIGTSSWVDDTNYRALSFQLENYADYMTWSYKRTSSASDYTTMLVWHKTNAKDTKGFTFYDNVRISGSYTFRNTYFRADASTSRIVSLTNSTWNDVSGVAIRRDPNRDGGEGGIFLASSRVALTVPQTQGSSTHTAIEVTRNYIRSVGIYNQTTSSTANVYISSNANLLRSTSSSKYKLVIENEEEKGYDYKRILNLNVKSWYDKTAVETYAEILNGNLDEKEIEAFPIKRHYGLIAEDVYNVGLSEFVTFNDDGEIEGIEYDRLLTLLIPIVREQQQKIEQLEQEIALMKGEV